MAPLNGLANALRSMSHAALKQKRSSCPGPRAINEMDEESPTQPEFAQTFWITTQRITNDEPHKELQSVRIEEVPKTPSKMKHDFQDPNGPPGQLYRGELKDSKKHGSGAMSFAQHDREGRFMYHGDFVDDKMHGSGTLDWHDCKKYKGQFANNKLHGEGVMTWPDGRKYIGHYVEGRKGGLGTVLYPDNSSYCGTFLKGKMHGEIVYTDKHGIAKLMTFREGKPVQVDTIASSSGDVTACAIEGRENSFPSDASTETSSVSSAGRSLATSGSTGSSTCGIHKGSATILDDDSRDQGKCRMIPL